MMALHSSPKSIYNKHSLFELIVLTSLFLVDCDINKVVSIWIVTDVASSVMLVLNFMNLLDVCNSVTE